MISYDFTNAKIYQYCIIRFCTLWTTSNQILEKTSHPILFSSQIQGMWQTCISGERYKARHQKSVSIKGSRDFRQ